jgi:hypothetical protein
VAKLTITIEAEVPDGSDIRSLNATVEDLTRWVFEEFGEGPLISLSLDGEELDEEMLNEARYGRLGQG